MNYPVGSLWRLWDLQVHTPYSYLNNEFPMNFDEYARVLLSKAVEKHIAVIGITDYFTIEGYKQLRTLLDDKNRLNRLCGEEVAIAARNILVLPNIELRTNPIRDNQGQDSRVNFHVIFSDIITPEQIEEDFLHEVKFTAEGNPGGADESWSLTVYNLEQLGRRLKQQHQPFARKSDLCVGMMNAVVDHGNVSNILEKNSSIFKNRYLLVVPADEDLSRCSWNGQGHLFRKIMIQKAHILFSANPGTREFGLGLRHPSIEAFVEEFKSLKACIHSSDAHNLGSLFEPDERRYTWIKADPTFAGLMRILKEPDTRVFIGIEPPTLERQRSNPTKYFNQISIRKKVESTSHEHWFDINIPINTGLVAIIGNKGSGKSALSDTIGLLGNSAREDHFSFLNLSKFRRPKDNKAKEFEASLQWLSGSSAQCNLSDNVDVTSVETVKYIPQHYLENICNEITSGEGSEFDKELKSVIFSHVEEENRLGFETFDDLIGFYTYETKSHIELLQQQLHNANESIATLDEKLSTEYRQKLEQLLQHKQEEFEAHLQIKPVEVQQPDKDPNVENHSTELTSAIQEIRYELEAVETEIINITDKRKQFLRRKAVAEKLQAKMENLQRTFDAIKEDCSECKELGINISDIVTFSINLREVEKIQHDADEEIKKCTQKLLEEEVGTPAFRRKTCLKQIDEILQAMDMPNQLYQQYLEQLASWEEKKNEIEGGVDTPGSLKNIKSQLEQLKQLPSMLEKMKNQRKEIVGEIYNEISNLTNRYKSLYSPIERTIEQNALVNEGLQIGFSVQIVQDKFEERFFTFVQQGRRGTFCGIEEGQKQLRRMLAECDFSTQEGILSFVEAIDDATRHDLRYKEKPEVRVSELLRKGTQPVDLYDFVFSLGYLSQRYALTWGNRNLEQLSPGERGALLLVFYLLVDKDTIPLVIDQPEENLDNESVYKMLVPCIKQAKERRQVIIVTHNPNLAVVCDADQIIYAEMDKPGGNKITYETGAIENPVINKHIVDVLEGTRPAFDIRDAKYKLVES
jgi:ABC-type lipoprotein export system ATPase subunit/uncharacterized protein YoxC